MKARTLILTAGATLALAVPAANAAIAENGLYHQAQVHTVLAEKNNQAASKSQAYVLHDNGMWVRVQTKSTAATANAATIRALRIRGDALNRKYQVGPYASFAYPSATEGQTASVAGMLSNTFKTPR